MRLYFKDSVHPARVAKTFRKTLKPEGFDIPLNKWHGLVAEMFDYANWHELVKSCASHPPSPWDDAIPEAEAAKRRSQYINVLCRAGIPRDLAERAVDTVRPTGRRQPVLSPDQKWRTQLASRRNPHGFIHFDPTGFAFSERWGGTKITEFPLEASGGFIVRFTKTDDKSEVPPLKFHDFEATLNAADGTILGYIKGSLTISPKHGRVSDGSFFYALDAESDFEALMANAIVEQHGSASEIFRKGNIVVLFDWMVASGKVPKGTGVAFLMGVLNHIAGFTKRSLAIALKVDPIQYREPDKQEDLRRRHRKDYKAAKGHLTNYLMSALAPALTEQGMRLLICEIGDVSSPILSPEEDVALLMAQPEMSHILDSMFNKFPDFATRSPQEKKGIIIRMLSDAQYRSVGGTQTLPGEPTRVEASQWPDGWNPTVMMSGGLFNPYPRIWNHLPSDLASIQVDMCPIDFSERLTAISDRPARLRLTFRNDTELEIDAGDLMFGRSQQNDQSIIPRSLRGITGGPEPFNPHTDRMSTKDMCLTLSINLTLLFSMPKGPEDVGRTVLSATLTRKDMRIDRVPAPILSNVTGKAMIEAMWEHGLAKSVLVGTMREALSRRRVILPPDHTTEQAIILSPGEWTVSKWPKVIDADTLLNGVILLDDSRPMDFIDLLRWRVGTAMLDTIGRSIEIENDLARAVRTELGLADAPVEQVMEVLSNSATVGLAAHVLAYRLLDSARDNWEETMREVASSLRSVSGT